MSNDYCRRRKRLYNLSWPAALFWLVYWLNFLLLVSLVMVSRWPIVVVNIFLVIISSNGISCLIELNILLIQVNLSWCRWKAISAHCDSFCSFKFAFRRYGYLWIPWVDCSSLNSVSVTPAFSYHITQLLTVLLSFKGQGLPAWEVIECFGQSSRGNLLRTVSVYDVC